MVFDVKSYCQIPCGLINNDILNKVSQRPNNIFMIRERSDFLFIGGAAQFT